jgi:hypothetical protein
MRIIVDKCVKLQKTMCRNIGCNKETIYTIALAVLIVFQVIQYVSLSERINSFMTVGPRFTAADGLRHCKLIRELQEKTGLPMASCDEYAQRSPPK